MSQTQLQAVMIGGTGDIGQALGNLLTEAGFLVTPISRSTEISCDLTNRDQIQEATDLIKQKIGKVDLLVNAAGVATYKPLAEVTDQDFDTAFMINIIGPAMFIRNLLPIMNHEGALVMSLGSGAGTLPMKERSIYSATKFALRGFSLSLSHEYRQAFPRFCLITLGSTLTNFGPLSVEEKKDLAQSGKKYLDVNEVAVRLLQVVKDPNRPDEVTIFPDGYQEEWQS